MQVNFTKPEKAIMPLIINKAVYTICTQNLQGDSFAEKQSHEVVVLRNQYQSKQGNLEKQEQLSRLGFFCTRQKNLKF